MNPYEALKTNGRRFLELYAWAEISQRSAADAPTVALYRELAHHLFREWRRWDEVIGEHVWRRPSYQVLRDMASWCEAMRVRPPVGADPAVVEQFLNQVEAQVRLVIDANAADKEGARAKESPPDPLAFVDRRMLRRRGSITPRAPEERRDRSRAS